ncbi:MAG: hypothetical protein NVS3B24_18470 [Candidatus Dormibacteria bacterium]
MNLRKLISYTPCAAPLWIGFEGLDLIGREKDALDQNQVASFQARRRSNPRMSRHPDQDQPTVAKRSGIPAGVKVLAACVGVCTLVGVLVYGIATLAGVR